MDLDTPRIGRYPMLVPKRELVAEFRRQPFGLHSLELQQLLNVMRSLPLPGKHFLFMTEPQTQWCLARWSESEPLRPEISAAVTFGSLEDAERHVFDIRWQLLFGEPPPQQVGPSS